MKQLPKNYDHQKTEKHWQEQWVTNGTYHWRDDLPREQTFVIDTPPPTVSGVLHMGHIFSYTQADFIARYQRMSGKDVFYPMGFDDNGLPTERLVEKVKGVRGNSMPRADFVAMCREVVKDAEEDFRTLFKSAALSVDWRQEYQTVSDEVCKLSQASFIDLLQKGEAYRDFRPTYWDWVDGTAIAQAEIEDKEVASSECIIEFGIMDLQSWRNGDRPTWESLEKKRVMTTRPELLGACVALMCHTDNSEQFVGKVAVSPLFNVIVPIIGDDKVNKEKGTGFVMCCTFGDDTDKEWVQKYDILPTRPILGLDGRIDFQEGFFVSASISFPSSREGLYETSSITHRNCINTAEALRVFELLKDENGVGLKPKQANTKIIQILKENGLLIGEPKPITHSVKCAERSGTPIEIIPTYQWFIKVADKKEALLKKGAEVNWHPEYMKIRFDQWTLGLKEDWCISRQRFFGIPFPVWFSKRAGEEGKVICAEISQLPIDPMITPPTGYTMDEVTPSTDVLDTWATSSISPQINARAISGDDKRYNKLFPADLRPQAHEIIRTWAFYTIAKAHLHADQIPWKNIIISGWCLASDKTKMSKSKGNVVTPVALIEEKGTDAVRYWASTSRLGTDTAFSEDLLKIGRKLVNKLWNASQFAALNLDKMDKNLVHLSKLGYNTAAHCVGAGIITEALDLWILSRLHRAISRATECFEKFEYCDARVAIENFFWNDFCDNYLELVKARAYGEDVGISKGQQQSALYTIYHCLDAILRLFAPFVPHITEELYSLMFDDKFASNGSIHARGNWVKAEDYPHFVGADRLGVPAIEIINVIRKAKSDAGVSIKAPVAEVQVFITEGGGNIFETDDFEQIRAIIEDVRSAGNVAQIVAATSDINLPYTSERGWFKIAVKLAKIEEKTVEEHKRNSAQAEYEKIDQDGVLHGAGSPDLTKHTVKVNVGRAPESLQRQK